MPRGGFSTSFSLLLSFQAYLYSFQIPLTHEVLITLIYLISVDVLRPFGEPQTNILSKMMSSPKPIFTASVGMRAEWLWGNARQMDLHPKSKEPTTWAADKLICRKKMTKQPQKPWKLFLNCQNKKRGKLSCNCIQAKKWIF